MTFDARALETLDAIHADVRELREKEIPNINTNIAIIQRDINAFEERHAKLPCVERGTDIVTLGHRTEILETDSGKRSANWAQVGQVAVSIAQSLLLAYLVSLLI